MSNVFDDWERELLGIPGDRDPGQILRVAGFLVTEMSHGQLNIMPTLDNGEQIEFIDAQYFEWTDREYQEAQMGPECCCENSQCPHGDSPCPNGAYQAEFELAFLRGDRVCGPCTTRMQGTHPEWVEGVQGA